MNRHSNKLVTDKNIYIAGKKFLVDDIYLMQKLGLRPEKKIKDKQRMFKLVKMLTGKAKASDTLENLFKSVQNTRFTPKRVYKTDGKVNMTSAGKVNPRKYEKYTTEPSIDSLSRKILYGANTEQNKLGFVRTDGTMRFDLNTLQWVENKRKVYIGNQYSLRPRNSVPVSNDVLKNPPLYGYNPKRDSWVSSSLLKRSALIPVVGLKK